MDKAATNWRHAIRGWHRASAVIVVAFVIVHLGNHVLGLGGQQVHRAAMTQLRAVYRSEIVEPLLFAAFAWQAASGVTLVVLGWKARTGLIEWAQAVSGLLLAAFLVIHVSAVVSGRLAGLDTDLRFAAAGFHVSDWPYFFAPYYFLAVTATFVHVGAAGYWITYGSRASRAAKSVFWTASLAGCLVATALVLMLSGSLFPLVIEARYTARFAL